MSAGLNGPPILYSRLYEHLLEKNICQNPSKSEHDKQICEKFHKRFLTFGSHRNCEITKEDYDNDLKRIRQIKK